MKQTLQTKLRRIGKRVGLTILAFAALTVSAQMNGTYTIQSGTATATNFTDWLSFSQALQGVARNDGGPSPSGGINGNVTVNVLSSLTTSATVQIPQVTGMSSYTISINGNSNTLTFAGPYEAISFNGGDYVKLSALTIVNTSSTNAIGIRFSNASDNNTIDKCNIQFSGIVTGTTSGVHAYIAFAASSTALTTASPLVISPLRTPWATLTFSPLKFVFSLRLFCAVTHVVIAKIAAMAKNVFFMIFVLIFK